MKDIRVGGQFHIGRMKYTVLKLAPGKLMVKGFGFRKWLEIAELQKKGAEVTSIGGGEC